MLHNTLARLMRYSGTEAYAGIMAPSTRRQAAEYRSGEPAARSASKPGQGLGIEPKARRVSRRPSYGNIGRGKEASAQIREERAQPPGEQTS